MPLITNKLRGVKMGNIKISFGSFGGRELTRVFSKSEIEGKSVKNVLESMLLESWPGKDAVVVEGIKAEMRKSDYAIAQRTGGINNPVRYEPIQLGKSIEEYEKGNGNGSELPELRFGVTGIDKYGIGEERH